MAVDIHLHWPFKNNNGHPRDVPSKICPCVSFGIWCCNVRAILHPGNAMRCDGRHPPDGCPLANTNDMIVSIKDATRLRIPD